MSVFIRKSQSEKDKEKKEADQQLQLTSYFKIVSVAVHQAKRTITKIRKIKRTRGRSIKRTKRRIKRTNAVKIPQDH
jgi:hypothetical protein